MSYQDKIIICTDALRALRGASSVRDIEITPISIPHQALTKDSRAGVCDPASSALASEPFAFHGGSLSQSLLGNLLFRIRVWGLQRQLILSVSPREKLQRLLSLQPDYGYRQTNQNQTSCSFRQQRRCAAEGEDLGIVYALVIKTQLDEYYKYIFCSCIHGIASTQLKSVQRSVDPSRV